MAVYTVTVNQHQDMTFAVLERRLAGTIAVAARCVMIGEAFIVSSKQTYGLLTMIGLISKVKARLLYIRVQQSKTVSWSDVQSHCKHWFTGWQTGR